MLTSEGIVLFTLILMNGLISKHVQKNFEAKLIGNGIRFAEFEHAEFEHAEFEHAEFEHSCS
jgi:hypothetical protein